MKIYVRLLLFVSIIAISVWSKCFANSVVFVTKFNPVRSIENIIILDSTPEVNTVPIVIESAIFYEMASNDVIFSRINRSCVWVFRAVDRIIRTPDDVRDGIGSLLVQQYFDVRTIIDIVSRGNPIIYDGKVHFNRLIESSLVLPLRGFVSSIFSDFQVWIDNIKVRSIRNLHRLSLNFNRSLRNISLPISSFPSSEGDNRYGKSNDELSDTYKLICHFSMYLWGFGGVFFGRIACNIYAPTPIWQRIIAAPVVPWSLYLFFYAGDLSFSAPVDSRLWNFPAYLFIAIVFVIIIFVLPNVRADESWGTAAINFIAPRLTQFFILYSLLLVLHRLNPLVSAQRKGLKSRYTLGIL